MTGAEAALRRLADPMKRFEDLRLKFIAPALAAAALAAVAAPAHADPADDVFTAFRQVCGDTRAEYPRVVTAAQGGWSQTNFNTNTMPGVTMKEHISRSRSAGDASLKLFAMRGVAKNAVNVSTCTVTTAGIPFDALMARAQAWLGIAPHETTGTTASFRFADQDGVVHDLLNAEMDAAAAGSGLQLVNVKVEGSAVTLDAVRIKK